MYRQLILVCIVAFAALTSLTAQTGPGFKWVRSIGGPNFGEFGLDCDVDELDNIYMTGEFNDGAIFGSDTLSTQGDNDLFLTKFDPYGNMLWTVPFGSTQLDRAYAVNVGADQSVFITGYGKVIFPSFTGNNTTVHARDALIARFDSSGGIIWGTNLDGDIYSEGTDVVGNSLGECYMSARMNTRSYIQGDTLIGNGKVDGMLLKWSPNGNYIWGRAIGGSENDDLISVAAGDDQTVVAGGLYRGAITVGSTNLSAVSGEEALLVKLDSAGNYLWAKGFTGAGDNSIKCVKVAPDGSIYFAGEFEQTMDVDGTILTATANRDIFYGKFNPNGTLAWAKAGGGTSLDFVDDIDIDEDENVYLGGFFFGNFTIGGTTLTSGGFDNFYIAGVDSLGNEKFTEGSPYSDTRDVFGVAVDGQRNVIASGSYLDMLDLPPLDSIFAVSGSRDMFLFKYATESPAVEVLDVTGLDGCADSLLEVHAQLRGYFPPTNEIGIELSDATGNFAQAPTVGRKITGSSGIVNGGIPLTYPAGTGYRVRLTTTQPVLTSNDNGLDLTFETELSPPLVLIGDTTVCNGSTAFIQLPAGYDSILWSNGSTSGFTAFNLPSSQWVRAVDSNGCSQTLGFNIVECVSLENESTHSIELYPNPTGGRFRLNMVEAVADESRVMIYDARGSLVMQDKIDSSELEIDLQSAANGIYLVVVTGKYHNWTGKIVVRR